MPEQRDHIRSEAVQDILTRMPHWMIVWGNTIVLVLLLLFFMMSWFIKYPDIITTEAVITSTNPPQKEYAASSGKIKDILVSDNEYVKEGDVLAMLENTSNMSDVLFLRTIVDTLNINQNIEFPIDKISMMSLGDLASAYAVFEKDYIDYTLNKSLDPYASLKLSNSQTEQQVQLRLKRLENQKRIETHTFQLARQEFNRHKTLYEKGVISLNEFELKQMELLNAERRLSDIDITISQLKQSLNDAFQNSKKTQIDDKIEDTRLFKNTVQSLVQLKQAIKSWELQYLITADIDGKVSFISAWSENQNIKQGELLFTIIPQTNSSYIAKIKAPIHNSGKIKTQQDVNVRLFNFPETEYGTLDGKVKGMSAIPDDEGFYLVNVSLSDSLKTSYGINIPFRNEMQGTAEIITEDLRLLERFFYQLRGLFS